VIGEWRIASSEWQMDLTTTRGGWLQVQNKLKPANQVKGCKLRVVNQDFSPNAQLATILVPACFSRLRLCSHRLQSVDKLENDGDMANSD